MKKALSLMLALLMAVMMLSACQTGGTTTSVTQSSDNTVVVGIGGAMTGMGPWNSFNSAVIATMPFVYQPLFELNGFGGELKGVLAKSYEKVDSKTVRITLYDNIKDSAGNPFTADDAIFSTQKCIESGNQPQTSMIVNMTKIDDYTFEYAFSADVMEQLGTWDDIATKVWCVTKAAYEASSDGMEIDPVTTSPYKVAEFVPGSSLTLTKVDDYWQTDATQTMYQYYTNADTIVFKFIPDQAQIAIALQNGDIDISNAISGTDMVLFNEGGTDADRFSVTNIAKNQAYVNVYNCSATSVCSDLNLRMAIAYSWDANAIIEQALQGDGIPVYVPVGTAKYADYNKDWDGTASVSYTHLTLPTN
jgi:ABC-type transport system substrate-binding protein